MKNGLIQLNLLNFLQMTGGGFEIGKEVSDDDTPTWCLEEEKQNLNDLGKLNEFDAKRLQTLTTLLNIRSELQS